MPTLKSNSMNVLHREKRNKRIKRLKRSEHEHSLGFGLDVYQGPFWRSKQKFVLGTHELARLAPTAICNNLATRPHSGATTHSWSRKRPRKLHWTLCDRGKPLHVTLKSFCFMTGLSGLYKTFHAGLYTLKWCKHTTHCENKKCGM